MTQTRPLVLINLLVEAPGRISGITRYAYGLIGGLLRHRGVRLLLVTCSRRDQLPDDIAAGVEAVITLPYIASTPVNQLRQRHALAKIVRRYQPDIIYGMNPMCPPVSGVPSIITAHDFYYEILPAAYALRHRLWWKVFFGFASRYAAGIACVSHNTARDAVRLHPALGHKTHIIAGAGVLPHGKAARPADLPDGPYVLLLGNITPNKHAGFLIEALRLLCDQGRAVNAVHAGRDLTGGVARATTRSGRMLMQPLGALADSELDAVLRSATALVQPSRYEGFGLPVIEAQERGVPVIASDIPVFREVMGGGGVLVPLNDAVALAETIHRMVNDTGFRDRLAVRARQNSERYSWDISAAAAVKMIAEITQNKPVFEGNPANIATTTGVSPGNY